MLTQTLDETITSPLIVELICVHCGYEEERTVESWYDENHRLTYTISDIDCPNCGQWIEEKIEQEQDEDYEDPDYFYEIRRDEALSWA